MMANQLRTVLVTGGAGYIGSHTAVALLERGLDVVIADNFANSSRRAVDAIQILGGRPVTLVEVDLCDHRATDQLFDDHGIDAVVHFAGLKAVGESVTVPLRYYRNNLISTLNLLESMAAHEIFQLVFSSSATVYGNPEQVPTPESAGTAAANPYGRTKAMIEEICADVAAADGRWHVALLRYFNPVGAHPSGDLGEDPSGVPNNLVPFVMQTAVGRHPLVRVYGDDYDTPDGTGVRDYIHVVDLALGHVAALHHPLPGCEAFNLGTGNGVSVLEVIEAARRVSGAPIPHEVHRRRPGDIAISLADPTKANSVLGWRAERTLDMMLTDAWRWQSRHPYGFDDGS